MRREALTFCLETRAFALMKYLSTSYHRNTARGRLAALAACLGHEARRRLVGATSRVPKPALNHQSVVSDAWSESLIRRCCGVDRRPIQRTATRARANQPVWRARDRRAKLYEPVAALWAINGAGSALVSPEAGDNRGKVGNHLKLVRKFINFS